MDQASFALIAHDLKNALGSLEAELESLIDQPDPGAAQSAYVHCAELRRQFIQFLTVYGSDDGLRVHCEDESPKDLLDALYRVSYFKTLAKQTALQFKEMPTNDAPAFWYLDRRLVFMALEAAMHNACRFAKSQVTLGLRQDGTYLVFYIEDDGPGLGAIDPSESSTGLGTALCLAVAQAHRSGNRLGYTRLSDRATGGACFEMFLP
jgi:signal transduction histidine kinase